MLGVTIPKCHVSEIFTLGERSSLWKLDGFLATTSTLAGKYGMLDVSWTIHSESLEKDSCLDGHDHEEFYKAEIDGVNHILEDLSTIENIDSENVVIHFVGSWI